MASTPVDSKIKMKTGEVELMYAEVVKRRLLSGLQKMTNKITSEVFNEIFQQLQESGAVVTNVDQIVQTFRDDLYLKISESFKDMWHIQEIDHHLNVLNFCNAKCDTNKTSWRPTGKTPEEQTKYLRIHYLRKKVRFVQTATVALREACEAVMETLQLKRSEMEELNRRRVAVSEQMDIRMTQISNLDIAASQNLETDSIG